MVTQVQQHEMALQQQMEQQRLRWKSEIVASNSMLNTVRHDTVVRISLVVGQYKRIYGQQHRVRPVLSPYKAAAFVFYVLI